MNAASRYFLITNDQQGAHRQQFFPDLDFRRFQVNIPLIEMDDVSKMDSLTQRPALWQTIVNDMVDVEPERPLALVIATLAAALSRRAP
jgi:hypothetical protein